MASLGACRKDERKTPVAAKGSTVGSAQVALVPSDAQVAVTPDAGGGSIDLFRAVPSTIRVSSRVKNKAIKPEHIADGDYETAWNSATGELVGAWIEIGVDGAEIDAVKLTAGHTGHGPKGEDYFTMNPRIKQVKLDDDGKPLRTYDLDITRRDLQTISVAPKGTLRITVTEIEPGSMAKWRETAISELQAWGVPAGTWKAPKAPLSPNVVVDGELQVASDPCEGSDQRRAEFIKAHAHDDNSGPGGEDHAYAPNCYPLDLPDSKAQLPPPWNSANGGCDVNDEIYGPTSCELRFKAGLAETSLSFQHEFASAKFAVTSMEIADVVPGGRSELVIRYKVQDNEFLAVCRDEPVLACAGQYPIGGTYYVGGSAVDASWTTKVTFDHGAVVIARDTGEPSDPSVLGRHPLW